MRYFLTLSYKGTAYAGWQRQINAVGIQNVVENALSTYLQAETPIMGSGRTDTGVHALEQVAHFDTPQELEADRVLHALNALLPRDIVALKLQKVHERAHARFDAFRRGYVYKIGRVPSPFYPKMAYFFYKPLDVAAMQKGANYFLGKQDFESLSKRGAKVNHYLCEVLEAKWVDKGDILEFHISANRFLHGMVRAIVGTLLDVGLHKIEPSAIRDVLAFKDRTKAGRAAPPQGLYLKEVLYPPAVYQAD